MNEKQRSRYRLFLLGQLKEAAPYAMTLSQLNDGQILSGFRDSTTDVALIEAKALAESGLLKLDRNETNRAVMEATLTEAGRVHLADNGL